MRTGSSSLASPYKPAHGFVRGLQASLPIAIGYVSIALSFGILAGQAGVSPLQAILMSGLVYGGASQFMAVEMIGLGATTLGVATATLILNFRHVIMGFSCMPGLVNFPPAKRWLFCMGLTDETFAMASLKLQADEKLAPAWYLGLAFGAYLSWVLGTALGTAVSVLIPESLGVSLGVALYAMFIALLVPAVMAKLTRLIPALAGSGISYVILTFIVPSKALALILGTLLGALVAVWVSDNKPVAS